MKLYLRKPPDIQARKLYLSCSGRRLPMLLLTPKPENLAPEERLKKHPGILWIHGGGYATGFMGMVYMGRAVELVRKYGATVLSPGYRLSLAAPYPAALMDCYRALLHFKRHAEEWGVRSDQLMVGGESAGGGLAAALCMLARDKGTVNIAYQMPLYPMLDDRDTDSSRDNHGRIWNTRRNHLAWRLYLRNQKGSDCPPYAAPARQTDYAGLPPAYTFVGEGEPFYRETLTYIDNLRRAGVEANVDVYPSDMHAFDMMAPDTPLSREAARRFEEQYQYAAAHFFAPQRKER